MTKLEAENVFTKSEAKHADSSTAKVALVLK